jgi:hypothetical protein
MTIRPQFKTLKGIGIPISRPDDSAKFKAQEFLSGLFTEADPKLIPDNALQSVKNVTYVSNRLMRRNGLDSYSIAKPDSLEVMALFAFVAADGTVIFLRFTTDSIYQATATGWTVYTGPALGGTIYDLYSFTVADGRAFFSNGGIDPIMEIDPVAKTYAQLGNAPQYKYLTSAFNRVVGAFRIDAVNDPVEVGWSGDLNYDEWDPLVDKSAGSSPIVNSPSDVSDDITGLFYVNSALLLPRQRSIWLATNLPSATNPFNFFLAVPGIGADVPSCITPTEDGIAFYNFENSTAYRYVVGGQPEEFSGRVKRALKSDIDSPENVFATYNKDTRTYSLFIFSATSSLVKSWSYSFESKAWTYDEYMNVSMVKDVDFSSSTLTIDQLSGLISALSGTINSLGGLVANANRFFGFTNGDLSTQPLFSPEEDNAANIVLTDNGDTFDCEAVSKTFNVQNEDSIFKKFSFTYTPFTTGTVKIYYSKDDGQTYTLWKQVTVENADLFITQTILIKKPKRAARLIWKALSSDCMFTADNFQLWADETNETLTST